MASDDGPTDSPTDRPDGAEASADASTGETRTRMAAAIRTIRREGWKAAVLESSIYATAAFLLTNVVLTLLDVGAAVGVALPDVGPLAGRGVPGTAVIGLAVGLAVLVLGVWLRVRRPLVEQFEAVNPSVAEALRTARDAVEHGADSRMAGVLYADVLERLHTTSSLGLLHFRRLGTALALVVALSLLTTQVAIYDVGLGGPSGDGPASPPDAGSPEYTGLEDGEAVLGDPEDVAAGDDNLTARIESVGGDEEPDDTEQFPSTSGPGGGGAGGIDSQQAGFDQPERLEDAELIREYNLRIREEAD